jgi:molybdopterin-containing oxidoreductase family molybdopterin binding subunit
MQDHVTPSSPSSRISGATKPDRVIKTVCSPNCFGTCLLNVSVKDDRIIKVEPAAYPDPGFERICVKGIAMATERIHHPKRLRNPMIRAGARGENRWLEASWDDAYGYIAERIERVAARDGWKANAWLGMTGNYGARARRSKDRIANTLGGTLFTDLGLMGDLASLQGSITTLGTFASNESKDIVNAKYLLFAGRNTADTGHSEMKFVFDALERGAKLVVIDPRFSRTAAKADTWIALRPGSDTALVLGMMHVIISKGLMDEAFVSSHTNGPLLVDESTGALIRTRDLAPLASESFMVWDDAVGRAVPLRSAIMPRLRGSVDLFAEDGTHIRARTAFDLQWNEIRKFTPQVAAEICNILPESIEQLAIEYATADPAWLYISQGIGRYQTGHTQTRAYIALAAICGNIGKPFAGASLVDGPYLRLVKNLSPEWMTPTGTETHSLPGTRMMEAIIDDDPYPVRSLWLDTYGFATQGPLFKRFVQEALPKLDLFVINEQMLTPAVEYADVALPVVSYYEDDWELVGGGDIWYMMLRRRAINPVGTSRNDYEIYKGICERLGKGEHWQMSLEETAHLMLRTNADPLIRAIDWETLKRDKVARVPRPLTDSADQIYTPFSDLRFETPSGKIELYQEQFRDIGEAIIAHKEPAASKRRDSNKRFPLQLMTYKHVHSAHSTHTILDGVRELRKGPELEIYYKDAQARNIESGDEVIVFNDRGQFRVKAKLVDTLVAGLVALAQGWWHADYPEGHPSDLGHLDKSEYQSRLSETNYAVFDISVDVRSATKP